MGVPESRQRGVCFIFCTEGSDLQHDGLYRLGRGSGNTTPSKFGLHGGINGRRIAYAGKECIQPALEGVDLVLAALLIGPELIELVAEDSERLGRGSRALSHGLTGRHQADERGGHQEVMCRNLSYSPEQRRPLRAACAFTIARPRAAVIIVRNGRTHELPPFDEKLFFGLRGGGCCGGVNLGLLGTEEQPKG